MLAFSSSPKLSWVFPELDRNMEKKFSGMTFQALHISV